MKEDNASRPELAAVATGLPPDGTPPATLLEVKRALIWRLIGRTFVCSAGGARSRGYCRPISENITYRCSTTGS